MTQVLKGAQGKLNFYETEESESVRATCYCLSLAFDDTFRNPDWDFGRLPFPRHTDPRMQGYWLFNFTLNSQSPPDFGFTPRSVLVQAALVLNVRLLTFIIFRSFLMLLSVIA